MAALLAGEPVALAIEAAGRRDWLRDGLVALRAGAARPARDPS